LIDLYLRLVQKPAFFMPSQQEFEAAVAESKQLTQRPGNDELLELYALYKQATEGDVAGDRPGGFDFKAIAKYDAWAGKRGITKEKAMADYVSLVATLKSKYA
jgi:diazepam-binding inhibitor (GABA receptor modulating acyl-CoA-binding protein)